MLLDLPNEDELRTSAFVLSLTAAFSLATVVVLCTCFGSKKSETEQAADAGNGAVNSLQSVEVQVSPGVNNADSSRKNSVIGPVESEYDAIGNVCVGEPSDKEPCSQIVVTSSNGKARLGPMLPPRNSDSHSLSNSMSDLNTTEARRPSAHNSQILAHIGTSQSVGYASFGNTPASGYSMPDDDDTYEDVDRECTRNSAGGDAMAPDDTYEAVDQLKNPGAVHLAAPHEIYSPSSSMHYERIDTLPPRFVTVQQNDSSIANDDYEPIPGRVEDFKTAGLPAAAPVVVPVSNGANQVPGTGPVDVYAVVDKSKKASAIADRNPPVRNLSQLYAKVSKTKKSVDGEHPDRLLQQSPAHSASPNGLFTPVSESDAISNTPVGSLSQLKPDSGYDTIEFHSPASPVAGSDYDPVGSGEPVLKDDVYEEVGDVIQKVTSSSFAMSL